MSKSQACNTTSRCRSWGLIVWPQDTRQNAEQTIRGYFCAKLAQEKLIAESSIPFSIVHATQFFEFVKSIADASRDGTTVRLAPVLIQPMAAEDVASAVGQVAVSVPVNGIVEVAGPERFRLDEFVRQGLHAHNDSRTVVTDRGAGYFGVEVDEHARFPAKTRCSPRHSSRPGSTSPRWVRPDKDGSRVLLNSASRPW